jgi:hypothetical protein
MKHTFVSFASNHGVPLEVVSDQTGTDPSTLMQFYAGIDIRRKRHFLLGEEYEEPDFGEAMKDILPDVKKRYMEIKDNLRVIEVSGKKTHVKKTRRKRKINWNAISKLIENPKSPARKMWSKALALHNKGLSDSEVKAELRKEGYNIT